LDEYIIAKYIRLSIEDAKTDSLSVENQRLMLNRYIAEMDMPDASVRRCSKVISMTFRHTQDLSRRVKNR